MDDMTKGQIDEYRSAFFAANLRDAPAVTYQRGWFKFLDQHWKSYRRGEIVTMTERLRAVAAKK